MVGNKITLYMSDDDIESFRAGAADKGMSQSAYLRLLIAEYEHSVPHFYKYRELISVLSSIDNSIHEVLINNKFTFEDRLALFEKMDQVHIEVDKLIKS